MGVVWLASMGVVQRASVGVVWLASVGVVQRASVGVVRRTSAGMICRCVPNRSHPEGSVEGLVDVVKAGQPVCPQGEEWGLDLKSSKSKTKYDSLCNCDYETCTTTNTCTCYHVSCKTSHVISCTYIGMYQKIIKRLTHMHTYRGTYMYILACSYAHVSRYKYSFISCPSLVILG